MSITTTQVEDTVTVKNDRLFITNEALLRLLEKTIKEETGKEVTLIEYTPHYDKDGTNECGIALIEKV